MAETSLTLDELVRKLMGDEHADVLRETLAWFVRELMEAEVAGQIGAGLHERAPERTTHRNGYREGSERAAGRCPLRRRQRRPGRRPWPADRSTARQGNLTSGGLPYLALMMSNGLS
jgi:transposase-like protein